MRASRATTPGGAAGASHPAREAPPEAAIPQPSLPDAGVNAGAGPRLFVLGFQMLFLELLLIRFLAGHIWNLGYFPNLVLLAAFIGLGFGFLLHGRFSDRAAARLYVSMPVFLALFVLAVLWLKPPGIVGFGKEAGTIGGELFFTSLGGHRPDPLPLELAKFAGWFLGVVGVFFLIGQRMAKLFRLLPPLRAYTLDISGSVAGILLFMLFSHLQTSASVWFLVFGASFWLAARGDAGALPRALAASGAVVLSLASFVLDNPALTGYRWGAQPWAMEMQAKDVADSEVRQSSRWSPYQRLTVVEHRGVSGRILANGIAHQEYGATAPLQASMYIAPYQARELLGGEKLRDVLVIGAGSGNDVAEALRHGAESVVAVDIDPAILEYGFLGRALSPPPYRDPRVETVVDDGRHYLLATDRRFDLVVFALTDSLVKVSSVSQLRLENYLFTLNSFRRAAELLNPGGMFVIYNHFREPWLVDKLAGMMDASMPAGSRVDTVILAESAAAMVIGLAPLPGNPWPPGPPVPDGIEPATDDWPFPYMRERRIPPHYLGAMAVMMGMALAALLALGRRTPGSDPLFAASFTFLGAAFLLLETKGVIQFSLLFGTTWLNNSLVFLAVLVSVLLGIRVADAVRSPRLLPAAAVLLFASAGVTLAVPLDALLHFGPVARFVLAGALMFTPIFMANLIFSILFRDRRDAELCFGWNLLGATVGGVLEYVSIATGYQALGWVVIALYAAALACAWQGAREGGRGIPRAAPT